MEHATKSNKTATKQKVKKDQKRIMKLKSAKK